MREGIKGVGKRRVERVIFSEGTVWIKVLIACCLPRLPLRDNHDALMAPRDLGPRASAVAAVARHLIEVRASRAVAAGGAWGISDSKRLWSHLSKARAMASRALASPPFTTLLQLMGAPPDSRDPF